MKGLAIRYGLVWFRAQSISDGHLTAYDAEYVALARRLACPLVTRDRDILKFYPAESLSPEGDERAASDQRAMPS